MLYLDPLREVQSTQLYQSSPPANNSLFLMAYRSNDSRSRRSPPPRPTLPPLSANSPPRIDEQSLSWPTHYDHSYYQFPDNSQRRLPPLNIPDHQQHYLPAPSAVRSPVPPAPYPPYPLDSRPSRYSPPPTRSYHHPAPTIPFASAEWNPSPSTPRHDDPLYPAPYSYPQQDRESWSDLQSPTDSRPEEPLVKKKRKRADANQLRVLNATYQRTAFPSTQERESLAKELDMSPRSVQIWFQNKRQSMRQSRNAANNLPPILHSAYSNASPTEPKPTHQSYHALSAEASSSRRRDDYSSHRRSA